MVSTLWHEGDGRCRQVVGQTAGRADTDRYSVPFLPVWGVKWCGGMSHSRAELSTGFLGQRADSKGTHMTATTDLLRELELTEGADYEFGGAEREMIMMALLDKAAACDRAAGEMFLVGIPWPGEATAHMRARRDEYRRLANIIDLAFKVQAFGLGE